MSQLNAPKICWFIYTTAQSNPDGSPNTIPVRQSDGEPAYATAWLAGNVFINGAEQAKTRFMLWNNFKGKAAVADMLNVAISLTDTAGNPLPSTNTFAVKRCVKINHRSIKPLDAKRLGLDENLKQIYVPVGHTATEAVLSGTRSTGYVTEYSNYAWYELSIVPVEDLKLGEFNFGITVDYTYA